MIFASDNWAGASENVVSAVVEAARRGGPAYSGDSLTKAVERRFNDVFQRDVRVFFVGTGTAANALALSAYARPGGVLFGHRLAHINVDEAGASSLFGGGTQLRSLDGPGARFDAQSLRGAIAEYPEGNVHHGRPVAVSVTELSELGTAYHPGEIAAIAAVAHANRMAVHMDGARFASAVAALGVSPAELTWKAGVDVMSFGATKNGCLAAEAVVFFDPAAAGEFGLIRQRAGHGFSKAWFIAAQMDSYLADGHWLVLAGHANAMAARLAGAIRSSGSARLAVDPDGNEIFAVLPADVDRKLKAEGVIYHPWPGENFPPDKRPQSDEVSVRLVTSFATTADEIDRFADLIAAG